MASTSHAAAAGNDHSRRGDRGQEGEDPASSSASSPGHPPGHAASPLLGALLDHLPEVFHTHVLARLDEDDLAMLGRACSASRKAVKSSGMSRAGTSEDVPLKNYQFFGSVERATWARDNGCKWELGDVHNCYFAASAGSLEVLKWLREQKFAWDYLTCYAACGAHHNGEWVFAHQGHIDASGELRPILQTGARHLELLQWAIMNGCPWKCASTAPVFRCTRFAQRFDDLHNVSTGYAMAGAAATGNIEMLRWLISVSRLWHPCGGSRQYRFKWHPNVCACAAAHNRLETLVWLRENGAPWDCRTTAIAASHGHLVGC